MADDAATYRPGDLARPEQQTSFSTPMFSVPDIQLDAGHEAAKRAFAQRQAQQPELAELHRQALETARNEPQERGWQEGAMREQPGRGDTTLYPESAVRSGIETAARSGLARGYEMGRQHAAAGTPAPARVVGRVFAGRDVSENMTDLATGTAE